MKNKKIFYLIIVLGLFCITQNSLAKTTFSELKKAAHNPKLTKKQEAKIKRYLSLTTSNEIKKGLNLLLEKKLDKKLTKAKNTISNFRIDGKIADWKNTNLIKKDPKNDTFPINEDTEKPPTKKMDDIKKYGFIMDDQNIYTMFQPYKMPGKNRTYHYKINLINQKGHIIYAILWTNWGSYIQEWNPETGKYVRDHHLSGAIFAKNNIFEAKIPIAKLINLPYSFAAEGVSWHEHHNQYDYAWQNPFEQSISEKYKKASAKLFFQYAKKIKLKANDPFPIVQALVDGFVYKFANKKIKNRVINDGIKMIEYAKNNTSYPFFNQIPLADNTLEALLAWANRSFSYGIYFDYYLANNKKLNKETYNFMFLNPDVLSTANSLILENNLYDSTSLENTIFQVESWLWNKNQYRAGIDFLRMLLEHDASFQKIYDDNLYEEKNHLRTITKINGFKIKKYSIYSPSFQLQYLRQNNLFYGNCGDISIIGQVFYKALKIPTFSLSYSTIAPSYYQNIHTFPVYYSSQNNFWYNFTKNGNGIYEWAQPENNQPYQIFYTLDHPQIGSYWNTYYLDVKNNNIWTTTNRPYRTISESSWQKINEQGFPMSQFQKMIYE